MKTGVRTSSTPWPCQNRVFMFHFGYAKTSMDHGGHLIGDVGIVFSGFYHLAAGPSFKRCQIGAGGLASTD
jgi:hypothetical protein